HLVTRLRYVQDAARDPVLSEDERRRGTDFAGRLSVRVLSRVWQMLLAGIGEVQEAPRPVSAAEMVLIRIAHAADLPTLDEALAQMGPGGRDRQPAAGARGKPVVAPRPDGGGNGGGGRTMRMLRNEPIPDVQAAGRSEVTLAS